jgi:hypothetical protein
VRTQVLAKQYFANFTTACGATPQVPCISSAKVTRARGLRDEKL